MKQSRWVIPDVILTCLERLHFMYTCSPCKPNQHRARHRNLLDQTHLSCSLRHNARGTADSVVVSFIPLIRSECKSYKLHCHPLQRSTIHYFNLYQPQQHFGNVLNKLYPPTWQQLSILQTSHQFKMLSCFLLFIETEAICLEVVDSYPFRLGWGEETNG